MLNKNTIYRHYIELAKPRIAFFCILMTAGGIVLAPGNILIKNFIFALLGTALSVASANTFNMIYERNTDKLMRRTKFRPLPMGKISVTQAFIFAMILCCTSIFLLIYYVNLLTGILSLLAILAYSLIYTPLKYKTPLALVIGAFPGAIPPLLGWTAVADKVDAAGLALFGVLFAWQMPHFIAIAIYHKEDYAKAGIKVVSLIRGEKIAKIQAFVWSVVLVLFTLSLYLLEVGGKFYLATAIILGIWFIRLSILGLKKEMLANWPRKFFLASLVYLPLLVIGLVADRFFEIFVIKYF
ncbi:heme o synthase [Pigmentibacter sp. JX0631]|uniref:heme o synthase n=1 Tax=Pigmentibacter sp. JX0631 TaxID=2976982 RepID=UPI002468C11D|nr:heme o synthase [Pigmentibacter sp. JX0631]WGL61316.1 heme o synthase [Pigmentibacter sp. JX0631]